MSRSSYTPFRSPDFQETQERVAERKAARARAREQAHAEEASCSARRKSQRSARQASSGRGTPVRNPGRNPGGMPPTLLSYPEAHAPNPALIGAGIAVLAVLALIFLVLQARSCLDERLKPPPVPVQEVSAAAFIQAHEDTGLAYQPMPLFEAPRVAMTKLDASALDGLMVDGLPLNFKTAQSLLAVHPNYTSRISPVLQLPKYESGCEVASLTVVARSMGYPTLVEEMVQCVPAYDSFSQGYAGSVTGEGGMFPRGTVKTANSYMHTQGSKVRGHDLTGSTFESLIGLVEAGYPVITWTTTYMEEYYPSEEQEWHHVWYWNEHVVVVYALENGELVVADPLEGKMVRNYEAFKDLYETCGSMAVVLY